MPYKGALGVLFVVIDKKYNSMILNMFNEANV